MTLQITLSAALISCLMHALWWIKCLFLRVWSCGRTEREQKGCKNRNVWSCVCILLSSWAFDLNFFILCGGVGGSFPSWQSLSVPLWLLHPSHWLAASQCCALWWISYYRREGDGVEWGWKHAVRPTWITLLWVFPPVKITSSTMLKIFANDGMMLSAVSWF